MSIDNRIATAIKRLPDADLQAEVDYAGRELAECISTSETDGQYLDWLRWKLGIGQGEIDRRIKLLQYGGAAYTPGPKTSLDQWKALQSRVPILTVADILKIETEYVGSGSRRDIKFHCPLHADEHASGVLHTDKGTWKCFQCQAGGTVIDLVIAAREAQTFREAVAWLQLHFGVTEETPSAPVLKPKPKPSLIPTPKPRREIEI